MVAAIPNLELSTLDGIAGDTIYLADLQTGLEGVEEGDGRGLAGLQCHFLRDGAENNMVGNIDLRDLVAAHRDALKENAPMVIRGSAGGETAIDLLDTVGHALDRLSVGNVFLQNFKSGLFVVHKGDLGGFTGAQRHGLLRIAHNVRLRHGFFPYHINICGDRREGGGTVHASRDGGGIIAGDGLHREHRAGNGFAAHGVPLGDLHIGQRMVFGGHGVLLVTISRVNIDAVGSGGQGVALRSLHLHERP